MTSEKPAVPDGGEKADWLSTIEGEMVARSGEAEYPDATMYSNRNEPAMGVRYDGEALKGIRVMGYAVVFGYADDRGVTVTLEENRLEVRKDGEVLSGKTAKWQDGKLPIMAEGIEKDLALISASEEVVDQ